MIQFLTDTPWVLEACFILGGLLLGVLTELFLVRALRTVAKRTKSTWDDLLIDGLRHMPIVWGTAAGMWGAMLSRGVDPYARSISGYILTVVVIASLTLVAMRWASAVVGSLYEKQWRSPHLYHLSEQPGQTTDLHTRLVPDTPKLRHRDNTSAYSVRYWRSGRRIGASGYTLEPVCGYRHNPRSPDPT